MTSDEGTTFARNRLVGAKTAWNLVRLAYVGGIGGTSFSGSSTPVSTRRGRPSGNARFMAQANRPSGSSLKRDATSARRAHRLQTAGTLAGLSPAGYAENSRNAWSEKPGQFTLIAMVSSACSSRRCTVIKRGMASLLEFELRSQRA